MMPVSISSENLSKSLPISLVVSTSVRWHPLFVLASTVAMVEHARFV